MKIGTKVKVWNSGTAEAPDWLTNFCGTRPKEAQRPNDEWVFLCEIPEDLAVHLANPEKRILCLHTKSHSGARVVGEPVAWKYAKEVE